jgi:hypothetical protein
MDICITDERSYAMSIRDYDEEKKDVTIKHYRIRKMDSGGCYISPKKTFNNMLELIEHYKGEFRFMLSYFDYLWFIDVDMQIVVPCTSFVLYQFPSTC